jgi:hypothetical protein
MSKKHKQSGVNYRKIYESYYGKIPKGYHIHHIDGNPFNNDISNLQCVSAEEHTKIHKNEFTKVDRKKFAEILKEGYSSGRIISWTKMYDPEEVHKRISSGDPGKSTRGKPAWNRGKKMNLTNRELANKRKSESALKKKKIQCPHCERVIDISNIKKHITAKHDGH